MRFSKAGTPTKQYSNPKFRGHKLGRRDFTRHNAYAHLTPSVHRTTESPRIADLKLDKAKSQVLTKRSAASGTRMDPLAHFNEIQYGGHSHQAIFKPKISRP